MRGEVPTIRPTVPTPRGDAEWFAQMIGGPRPTLHHANRQSSIRNHQSEAVYEYDVYGQPGAADPDHPNPFAFTGRRFDPETGLYYYRARYYNPTLGRFLQTDPIGYGDGMNMYAYCGNGPVNAVDALGTAMLTQATGRLAISQGPETTSYLQGATMTVNWTHIKDIGSELLGQAAEVYGFVHDVGRDVAIHTIQELMGGVAGGIVGMARQAAGAATTVGGGWRAFIEVKDYNDINGNEEVDPDDWESRGYAQKDLWGKPYWVELKGVYPIGTPQNPTGGAGSHWGDVVGYDSAEAALGACHRAMALLAQPVLVSKAFGGYWDSGHASPLERVNWYISLQLSVADATTTFLENLVVVPGETK